MIFSGKTILTDMDGTLLNSQKKISEKTIRTIDYFRKNGGTFTIASGRLYKKIMMYADILNLDVPIVASNGAVIYDTSSKKVVYEKAIDKKCLDLIDKIHNIFPNTGIEVASVDRVEFIYPNDMVTKHINDEDFYSDFPNGEIVWKKADEINIPVTKIMFCDYPDQIERLSKTLPHLYSEYDFFKTDEIYYEMVGHGTNKGWAVPKLKAILGERAKKLYTVGDNMNDVEMLKNSDMGICVKNANDDVKKIADFILPYTNDEDAIAHLIQMIEKGMI